MFRIELKGLHAHLMHNAEPIEVQTKPWEPSQTTKNLAEEEGFEPPNEFPR